MGGCGREVCCSPPCARRRGGRRQVEQGKGLATEVRAERWARDACGGVPAGGGAAEVRAAAHHAASWKMLSRAPLKLSGLS